jgi:hypothetical protein
LDIPDWNEIIEQFEKSGTNLPSETSKVIVQKLMISNGISSN